MDALTSYNASNYLVLTNNPQIDADFHRFYSGDHESDFGNVWTKSSNTYYIFVSIVESA